VGHENRALLSRLPALPRETAPEPVSDDAVTQQPEREPTVAFRSKDDSDLGWGGGPDDSNDDRLRQDKPPHW